MNPQTLDRDIVNLAKAIREVESNNRPVLPQEGVGFGGKSRYQYSHDTWKGVAEKFLGNPNAELNLENENKATYLQLKEWKDRGKNVGQIASMWNAGEDDPDAYLGYFSNGKPAVGVNEFGVEYNVPRHAKRVAEAYQRIKNSVPGGTYNPPPEIKPFEAPKTTGFQNLQENVGLDKKGLTGEIAQDLQNVGAGISSASQRALSGEINPASGLLQGAGAVAGGVGQVIDTAISSVPVIGDAYNYLNEKVVGPAIGAVGEATGATAAFNKLSPEAQGNIGATGNLLSLVPFFRAFRSGKRGLQDVSTNLREGSLKKDAALELEQSLGNSQLASRLVDDGAVKRLVDRDAIPDVVETGKDVFTLNVDDAMAKIDQQMKDVIRRQDEVARSQLSTYRPTELGGYTKLGTDTKITAPVQDSLEALQKHYTATYDSNGQLWLQQMTKKLNEGEITVADINDVARKIGQAKSSYLQSGELSSSIPKQAWENLRRDLKDVVGERDVTGEMRTLDKDYSKLANEKKALIKLKGKRVPLKKEGLIKGLLKEIPGSGFVLSNNPSTATMRLRRRRPLQETARQGLMQVGAGMALSNQLGQEQEPNNI